MNKKLIAAILSVSTLFSAVPFAAADNDKVEISFKVGDSILKINGAETEVETPYVAGEGTTLVPLRVITEAFGAQVDWDGTTKTITLSYPDVNIVLQIDNIIAKVNDHSETLLEAPALSANGVTMVPLRFISETFGAVVGYDGDTGGILVTKEKADNTQTVTGITEMTRTGDSYYNWSIDTPNQMQMTDRSLDGRSTEFTADDDSSLSVNVYTYTADTIVPFEEEFSKVRDTFTGYTLMEAEKPIDNAGNQYIHFQAKDKEHIVDYREYYGKDYTTYDVISIIKIDEDTSVKDMILSISDSFRMGAVDNKTYDLSNVSNNMRVIKDDKYKLSFKVPANFRQNTNSDAENEFRFHNTDPDSNASVSVTVYSKTADVTAMSLAQKDHDQKVKIMNPEFSTVTDVVKEDNTYRYTHNISGSSKGDSYMIDSFFEKGDYVYNIAAEVDSKKDEKNANLIVSSIEAEELDSAQIGKLLRNDYDDETSVTNTVGDYSFKLPSSWRTVSSGQAGSGAYAGAYLDVHTGAIISFTQQANNDYRSGMSLEAAIDFKNYLEQDKNNHIVNTPTTKVVGSYHYVSFTYTTKHEDGSVTYSTVYMKTNTKELITFTLVEDDIFYHKSGNDTFLEAIKSISEK